MGDAGAFSLFFACNILKFGDIIEAGRMAIPFFGLF
jgi:hypothetical protein